MRRRGRRVAGEDWERLERAWERAVSRVERAALRVDMVGEGAGEGAGERGVGDGGRGRLRRGRGVAEFGSAFGFDLGLVLGFDFGFDFGFAFGFDLDFASALDGVFFFFSAPPLTAGTLRLLRPPLLAASAGLRFMAAASGHKRRKAYSVALQVRGRREVIRCAEAD